MNKTNLFKEIITDIRSWEKYKKSKEMFIPLLKYIYEINNIKFSEISSPAETSNAIFRTGDTIAKIFPPTETNLKDGGEYTAELEGIKFCKSLGINTPDIICHGTAYENLQSFPYIIMTYIDGVEADTAFLDYSKSEKIEYVLKLKEIAQIINIPTDINIPRYDDPDKLYHENWNIMPEAFREDRKRYIENADFPEAVFNQGDTGGRNVIIDKQGRLNMVDFASCLTAPWYYEIPWWDEDFLVEAYYGDYKNDEFYDVLLMDTMIYPFGAFNIKWSAKEAGVDFNSLTSVDALKNMIIKGIEGGK